jgi:hypothetical protein
MFVSTLPLQCVTLQPDVSNIFRNITEAQILGFLVDV